MENKALVLAPGKYDVDKVSASSGMYFDPEEDQAQQNFLLDVDINAIVKRFGAGGDLPVSRELAEFGDFSSVVDFQSAMEQLRRGQEAFLELPPVVRERFNNDPGRFWEFLQSEDGVDEAVSLGLLEAPLPPDGQTAGPEGPSEASDT